MHLPPLFRDRPRPVQVVLGGVIPLAIGVLAGIMVGISAGAYWAVGVVAAVGGVLAGLEHRDGWGGADRGVVGGGLYGIGLLAAHGIAGTDAKVSLGSFPPLLAVVTAIIGMLLGALGGRIARVLRQRAGEEPPPPPGARQPLRQLTPRRAPAPRSLRATSCGRPRTSTPRACAGPMTGGRRSSRPRRWGR